MDDDLGLSDLIKNKVGIRRRCHASDGRVVRARADLGVKHQKVDDRLNAGLNTSRSTRRIGGDVIENRIEVSESGKSIAKPHNPCLLHIARTR